MNELKIDLLPETNYKPLLANNLKIIDNISNEYIFWQ